ncbi:Hypothetical predicted protein, partial [Marmota monax]
MIALLYSLLIVGNQNKRPTARFGKHKKKGGKEWKENAPELGEWSLSEAEPTATSNDTHLHHKVLNQN